MPLNWMRHWRSIPSCNNRWRIWIPRNWKLPVRQFVLAKNVRRFNVSRLLIERNLIPTC